MSYDLRVGVKVEGCDDLYAVISQPEYHSPTYNIGEMLRACTGWDFEQSKWYKALDVVPNIEHGIHELRFNKKEYEKYNDPDGWGTTESALEALESLLKCIQDEVSGSWTWNQIPLDALYVCW